jgi:predicted ABC-type ATPase
VDNAERAIDTAYAAGQATNRTETIDQHRQVYSPERAAVHKEIVGQHLAQAETVPSEGRGLMMGGLGGAGKSTVLKNAPGIDLSRFAVVNPDDIKAELAKRGLVPPIEGLSPMEASTLVHQESRHVANLVSRALMRRHKNVAFDITMNGQDEVGKRLDWFDHHGYRDVHGVFVDVPAETAVERSQARHRKGLEAYRQGKGLGERLVPSHIIRSAEISPGLTRNRAAFDAMKHEFSSWQLYDNSGAKPVLADSSAAQSQGGGITSVEDLMRQQQQALDTEPAASAAEHGAAAGG